MFATEVVSSREELLLRRHNNTMAQQEQHQPKTRYTVHPLPAGGGIQVVVPVCPHIGRLCLWTTVHVPFAAAVPVMFVHEIPVHVIALCAVPIAFALWVYLGWALWQLRGVERYEITGHSWRYESGLAGLMHFTDVHYDFHSMGTTRLVVGQGGRFGFEGHLKMGHAFGGEDEVQLFLADVEAWTSARSPRGKHPYLHTASTARSPSLDLDVATLYSLEDLPMIGDDMLNAMMIPMLDLSDRGHDNDDLLRLL
ncbi:hypothetical protein DYB37_008658 [Aphanomyces astaci]|uniref:Uncharacterized protein n=3 Tax=Aphanomyces astaci TaxID=112090 RepID=A0A397DJT2_APHAT|nr:hypothetical protein DYB36_005763 [Aphanomyces astaci]RHY07176.1 hypothetical protein DYB25_000303 [Aphanomyces astaci]RHY43526.1 hypothetical protein DYB34_000526 [Aphanomyces astaci]RHY63392.1 hypothetical protein DYB30_001159 [Aphanomyces astaci]RHY64058.1 hypothetical protein DYB38_000987 [Aphanomyces astaci]